MKSIHILFRKPTQIWLRLLFPSTVESAAQGRGLSNAEPTRANIAGGVGSGGTLTPTEWLEKHKTWVIVGVVTVLLLVALIQAIYAISRMKKNRTPPANGKVRSKLRAIGNVYLDF